MVRTHLVKNGFSEYLGFAMVPTPLRGRSAASAGPRWAKRLIFLTILRLEK
jgi:hypothetical protein